MKNIILAADERLLFQARRLYSDNNYINEVWKFLAKDLVYLIPIFLVISWFSYAKAREASIRGAVTGALGWLVLTPLISQVWYRTRPVDSGIGIKEALFHRPTYSFPSDHALFAFAVASAFYFAGHKKIGSVLYVAAFLISLSRVVVGIHYPLDVIAGAIIGIGLSWLVWHFRGQFDSYVTGPITYFMKFIRLA